MRWIPTQSGNCSSCGVWCDKYRQKTYRLCCRCHTLWHRAGCPKNFRCPRGKQNRHRATAFATLTASEKAKLDRAFMAMSAQPDEPEAIDWSTLAEIREAKHREERESMLKRNPARIPGWESTERVARTSET